MTTLVTKERVFRFVEQNPNCSTRDLMEIAEVSGTVQEPRFKDMIKTLEATGRIERNPEKVFCEKARKPVWTWKVKN